MRKHGIFRKNLSLHIQKNASLFFKSSKKFSKNGLTY